jgi:hypothetical protein
VPELDQAQRAGTDARCARTAAAAAQVAPQWPANKPQWFSSPDHKQLFYPPRQSLFEEGGHHWSQSGEDEYAFKHFFYGMVSGSYLEVGM